jgi:16S rRNA pseudouridine516 synthase
MRLDAFLARAGMASRREARGLIRGGRVVVAGEVCRDAASRIVDQDVRLDGELVESPERVRNFILHKPVGYACSEDDREAPLVRELLSETLRRRSLRIAGRLDRATSGLLLLTTDGDLVHRVTHPTRKLPKRYRITYEGALVSDAVARCASGIVLHGEEQPTRPADLEVGESGRATLVLREGRRHQVRRMIRALGGEVLELHRDRIGALELPADLEVGDFRPLAEEERALLLKDNSL